LDVFCPLKYWDAPGLMQGSVASQAAFELLTGSQHRRHSEPMESPRKSKNPSAASRNQSEDGRQRRKKTVSKECLSWE
jgi:hypothetical protein